MSHKLVMIFIFSSIVVLSALFGHFSELDTFMMIVISAFAGAILSKGFIENSLEPMKNRSNELELLSRQTLHELNIPVATILANTQMLINKSEDEKSIRRLQRISQAARTLEALYKELDYMIKDQTHNITLEVCDLAAIIHEKIHTYTEIFPFITFSEDLESSSVKIDTIGFVKVLDNLVHNAVKYSQKGSTVKISLRDMRLSIEDEGIGMEEEFMLNAFENYFQEDENASGQGLGLAMVKNYCDRYKIRIFLDSKKDAGSKVTLDIRSVRADK